MRKWYLAACGVAAAALAGCGSSMPPVAGVVTMDGAPLAEATVTFIPAEPSGQEGVGFTKVDGSYEATTRQGKKGLPPGAYKVVISKKPVPSTDKGAYDPAALKEEVPATYSDGQASTLSATVDLSKKTFDFALEGGKKRK